MASQTGGEMSQVANFYNERNIFVTGGTGFIGKVLVHKLLTACPGIGSIYILVRSKRGKDPSERLKVLLDSPIFKGLSGDLLCKVVAVEGDITLPKLGLSAPDEALLTKEVSVVFHSAATVKFDEDLSKSMQMNVGGTLAVIDLARKMGPNLASFVHVSTAYSHCYQSSIKEEFYVPHCSPEDMIEISKRIKPDLLDSKEMTRILRGDHPNTYTFTKALAEQAVKENASDLPLSIFRPSIVVAAAKEPMPGWIDNLNGPTGLMAGFGGGLIRTAFVDSKKKADIVPVDLVVNMMCIIGWKTSKRQTWRQTLDENLNDCIPLYNFTSGGSRPFTWGNFEVYGKRHFDKNPFEYMLWLPGGSFKSSRLVNTICEVLFQWVPAFFVDLALRAFGQKPFMRTIVTKISKGMQALEYFANREWSWTNDNVHNLNDELSVEDKELFAADLRTDLPNWEDFVINYFKGVRHYVLKNDPSTVEWCKKKCKVYVAADYIAKALLLFILYKVIASLLL